MEKKKNIQELLGEYDRCRSSYQEFSTRLKTILEEILDIEGCRFVFIESRSKHPESLKRKLRQDKFETIESVNDLAGVRVTTYVSADIKKIEDLLPNVFSVTRLKVDERLGVDRVGYRSHHWLIELNESRLKLPEYKRFSGLKAELQIRTILQHAWAQIGHNQIYKPSALLPEKIKRDFSLLSGLLEIADNEFSRISKEIVTHSNEIDEKTGKGDLNILIDSISLRNFLKKRFDSSMVVKPQFGPQDNMAEQIIEELNLMGITTLQQLDSIIPKDIDEALKKYESDSNFCGLARLIMIKYNPTVYFENAWRNVWAVADEGNEIFTHYGIDLKELVNNYVKKD